MLRLVRRLERGSSPLEQFVDGIEGNRSMNILGHGVDIVDVSRIATLLARGEDFLLGWFTTRELGQLGERAAQANVVAGRTAAKEASVKALGCGFDDEVSWQDVEILTSDAGAPSVCLSGGAAAVAARLGVATVFVSISHEANMAIASAIAVGAATDPRT